MHKCTVRRVNTGWWVVRCRTCFENSWERQYLQSTSHWGMAMRIALGHYHSRNLGQHYARN